jgi:HK97 family phage portal protein
MINLFKKWFGAQKTGSNETSGQRTIWVPITAAGMYVDHDTALNLAAVYACVRYVAETTSSLSWHVYRRLQNGGHELALTSPVDYLLHTRPNPEMSAFNFRTTMLGWANMWGNAYAEIERDLAGRAKYIWPISPDRVQIKRDASNMLYYEITQGRGAKIQMAPANIFHLSGMGFDGIKGYSVVSLAAQSIGAGLAADQFAASFYSNSTVMAGGFKHPGSLSDEAYDRLKEDFEAKFKGPKNAWKPIFLEEGMEWQTFGMPLKDAQFLESRKFTITEIARWFRVPPHKIADLERATFTNIEHQSIEVVQDTIMPWALRLEQEADFKLVSPRNRSFYRTKLNLKSLMRGDDAARSSFYQTMRNMGTMNVNEIRVKEDMNPIGPDGDKYVMQGQYTTLDKIGQDPAPQLADPDGDAGDDIEDAHRKIFLDAAGRILRREEKRVLEALENYGEQAKLIDWMNGFYDEHKNYIQSNLKLPIETYCKVLSNGQHQNQNGQMDLILNFYTEKHINESRQHIIERFEGGQLWTEAARSEMITDYLMDQVMTLAMFNHKEMKNANANS